MTANTITQERDLTADDLLEDALGLSVRGLRTIIAMFARPQAVFEAARTPGWGGRYTPSLRLVFSILAVLAFFSFFWGAEDGDFVQGLAAGIEEGSDNLDADASRDFAKQVVATYAGILPFAYLGGHLLSGSLFRIWGQGTGTVARIRLHFAGVVPSMFATLIFTMLIPVLPFSSASITYTALSIAGVFVIDTATAMRGGVRAATKPARFGKALLFGVSSHIGSIIASIVAFGIPTFLYA